MSEKQKPQNPIFLPCEGWESNKVNSGMNLRDWFAGMALQGELARDKWGMESIDIVVRISYRAADAMIAQRNKI